MSYKKVYYKDGEGNTVQIVLQRIATEIITFNPGENETYETRDITSEIPMVDENADYQEFLKFVDGGGEVNVVEIVI